MRARALVPCALLAAGCSFLLDFPEEANQGGGAVEGGGGGTCSAELELDRLDLVWQGAKLGAIENDYVTVTGLAQDGDATLMFGESSNEIEGLNFPISQANLLFAIEQRPLMDPTEFASIAACDPVTGDLLAGRASLVDHELFISGSVPAEGTTPYGFNGGSGATCDGSLTSADAPAPGKLPLFARLSTSFTKLNTNDLDGDEGVNLDTATNGVLTVGIGVAKSPILEAPLTTSGPEYYVVRSHADDNDDTPQMLGKVASDNAYVGYDLVGAIDVDEGGTIWATGDACDDTGGMCPDDGELFVSYWPFTGTLEEVPIVHTGRSFGAATASGDGLVFIGGGYEGTLTIAGEDLDDADDVNPFVVAIDAVSHETEWVYPAPGATHSLVTTGFQAVVDLAYAGTVDCSDAALVYVVGCVVNGGAPVQSCSSHLSGNGGRHTFLVALDAATGAELWGGELGSTAASDLLIPTTITSDGNGFWVALSFRGSLDLPTGNFQTGVGAESLVLRYKP